jgi:hypothetical protein
VAKQWRKPRRQDNRERRCEKKLGVMAGQTTWRLAMPDAINADDPPLLLEAAFLRAGLTRLRPLLAANGMFWVSER